jgi:hypothetical protein
MSFYLNGVEKSQSDGAEHFPITWGIFKQTEDGKEGAILLAGILHKQDKFTINKFLTGTEGHLRRSFQNSSEPIATLVDGKSLQLLKSVKSEIFKNAFSVIYGASFELSSMVAFKADNDDQAKIELANGIRQIVETNYPIPLQESWTQDFIDLLSEGAITKLKIRGKSPFTHAYYVKIDTHSAGRFVSMAYGKSQFKALFGRAPKIAELWSMIDPNQFSVKTWQTLASKVNFEAQDSINRESLVHLYEIFGVKTEDFLDLLEKEKIHYGSLSARLGAIKTLRGNRCNNADLILKGIKLILSSKEKKQGSHFLMINAMFGILNEDLSGEMNSSTEFLTKLMSASFSIIPGGEPMAIVASDLWMSDEIFKKYQDAYIAAAPGVMKKSRQYPTVEGGISKEYTWESMDVGNPRALVVGLETNCCQHLDGAGSTCVKFALDHPDKSGIFRVMKNGDTVAQSWFWFNQEKGTFVFDNIEVLGSNLRDNILNCYLDFIEHGLKPRAKMFGIKAVTVGLGCNDMPSLSNFTKVPAKDLVTIKSLVSYQVYSDAGSQVTLATF